MPRTLVLGGAVVNTPDEVLEHYAPSAATMSATRWRTIRPLVVEAVGKANYTSAWGAHFAMRTTSVFVSWAVDQHLPLETERVFTPSNVERFCATCAKGLSRRTRANYRSALRSVARAATKKAPWPPEPKPYSDHVHLASPYTEAEVASFWRCAESQATEYRTRILTVMLTLGLGAGLKVSELLAVSADEHVRVHYDDERLWVIALEDRTVPVLAPLVPRLQQLCREYPTGPLIGKHQSTAKDPLGTLRRHVEIPSYLPTLTMSRLRTTWMTSVLMQPDVRISEFMLMAGTVSSKTLECIAPFIPYRAADDEYLFKGAGL